MPSSRSTPSPAAGTSKPAIYRRWPSKAHLVHEAVFPIGSGTELPDTGSLAEDVREMVRRTVALLTTPAARAALPGLVGEMAADLTLHAALLERFGDILARGLTERLNKALARNEVRPDVTARNYPRPSQASPFLLCSHGAPSSTTPGSAHGHPDIERNQLLTEHDS